MINWLIPVLKGLFTNISKPVDFDESADTSFIGPCKIALYVVCIVFLTACLMSDLYGGGIKWEEYGIHVDLSS